MTFNNFEVHRFTPTFTIPFYPYSKYEAVLYSLKGINILFSEHERMDQKFSESDYFTRIVLIQY